MKKKKIIAIVCAVLFVLTGFSTLAIKLVTNRDTDEKISVDAGFNGKIGQWSKDVGFCDRKIPTETSNEGLNARYPIYGTSLSSITDEEKDNILAENSQILASSTTYNSMDSDGNLYLDGVATGKKLYKHTSSVGMYYGNVKDDEKAVIRNITISPREVRNYVTGLYAPAGEVVKIEMSKADLEKTGGLTVYIGQVSHRNNVNNIWKARNDFCRMPVISHSLTIKTETAYVGSPLGGPIYIYPANFNNKFSVKISGAVPYAHYIHGQTTREEVEEMKNYSAPYYDYEIWDLGVRFSGPTKYANFDYDNLVKVGDLWEKIIRTSRQVPCSANATIGVGYVFDCFVAAGSACAFQGGHSWINAPCNWMPASLNYNSMVTDGFWGNIHEYNHLYQSYGMESSKTNEVTNNATSLLSYVSYTKISDKRSLNDSTLGGWERFTDPSRSLRETLANASNNQTQSSLNAYADLIHSFGVDTFAKATRLQNGFGVDNWYEALSKATGYNFTYYFEKLLGQKISDDKKALYDTKDRIVFVPVATVFQTGRDYYSNGKQVFVNTVRPYRIERGKTQEIDFNERLILPNDFTFTIKNITQPKSGKIVKIGQNKYNYVPSSADDSGTIKVTISLKSDKYTTKDVTLALAFRQYDKNQVEVIKYTYAGDVKYSNVEEALNNNFDGYSSVQKYNSTSTFLNGLANKQVGIVEGKIYIAKTGNYAICLRSGRGNNTLYLAVNDKSKLAQVMSFNSDHGGFVLDGENVTKLTLNAGDYVYFREITLSRHYANDAFTELGFACLDDENPKMATVPTNILCTNDMLMPSNDFTSNELYKHVYNESYLISSTSSGSHSLVSANMNPWDNTTEIENIFDGNPSTFFHNNRNNFLSESNPFILVADMKKTARYNSIKITSRTQGQYNLPVTFKLFGSLDNKKWNLLGDYTNLGCSGNTVSASFDEAEFRYYKLYITDTKSQSSGNKYVTISSIDFTDTFAGTEISPYDLGYFREKSSNQTFTKQSAEASYGFVMKGNGIVKFNFTGTGFMLRALQDNACKIRVTVDGKSTELNLDKSNDIQFAYVMSGLKNSNHNVAIKVLSGKLCVDSVLVKSWNQFSTGAKTLKKQLANFNINKTSQLSANLLWCFLFCVKC